MESLSNYQELWDNAKVILQEKLAQNVYNELFKETYVYKIAGTSIIVIVPSTYIETKINKFYLNVIQEALEPIVFNDYKFVFKTKEKYDTEVAVNRNVNTRLKSNNNLDPSYTFENFVKGDSNIFAFRSAMKVAETPGLMNPLYIFGDVGLGKTHLMQAIGNYVTEIYPDYKVLYVPCINFVKDYQYASQTKNMNAFIDKYYCDLDLLLVDDIQQIEIGEKTQFEFFNLFNELYSNHKQIVIASDKPANKLKIMDRLSSRFSQGLIVDITVPDLNQRMNILKQKMEERNIPKDKISNESLEFVANNFKDNIRMLDGALTRVLNYYDVMGGIGTINLSFTMEALDKLLQSQAKSKTNDIDNVIDIIADFYQITRSELISSSRNMKYVVPRQICMYLLKNKYDLTYSKIGKILGNRDHSTVMSGATKIERDLSTNQELKSAVDTILAKLSKVDI